MTLDELRFLLARELMLKSGVREWEDPSVRASLVAAAAEMAASLFTGEGVSMVAKLLITPPDGTPKQICFADHANDFSPTAANDLRVTTDASFETDCQLSLAGVANAAARQSAKVDLGANWAREYDVRAALEFAATPTGGNSVYFYWAPSNNSTAATGNPGGVSGSDAAYAGYSANLAEALKQLMPIGVFTCTVQATATVQVAACGRFRPPTRYGSLIVENQSGAAIHSDDVECHVVFDPVVDESQ